jgi:rhodanese-related sulfurtransferase
LTSDPIPDPIPNIDAATAKRWLDEGDTVMIDVREPAEVAREHVPLARLAPLSSFDPAALALGPARRVVMLCASGIRSAKAGAQLAALGGREVVNLTGGIGAWKRAGLPVSADRATPLPIMRQVQLAAGALILLGAVLGALVHPWFFALCAVVGAGLFIAGATGWCGMALLLQRLPYNRRS